MEQSSTVNSSVGSFVLYNSASAILHRRYTALFATEATIALICGVQRVLWRRRGDVGRGEGGSGPLGWFNEPMRQATAPDYTPRPFALNQARKQP